MDFAVPYYRSTYSDSTSFNEGIPSPALNDQVFAFPVEVVNTMKAAGNIWRQMKIGKSAFLPLLGTDHKAFFDQVFSHDFTLPVSKEWFATKQEQFKNGITEDYYELLVKDIDHFQNFVIPVYVAA